jgi:predicted DNA-binding transcriptional regulator YafY
MQRILKIKQMLKNGESFSVDELSLEFGKHRETIKRDMRMIRESLERDGIELLYQRATGKYQIQQMDETISVAQVYTILSILHGNRCLNQEEYLMIENNLGRLLDRNSYQQLKKLIHSFNHHYRSTTDNALLDKIDLIIDSIMHQKTLAISYANALSETRELRINPYTIIFDEGYFYVIVRNPDHPEDKFWNLRIDRIKRCEQTSQTFVVDHNGPDFFKPGEYANYAINMFGGERPKQIKLRVRPNVVSYFEDKFPIFERIARDTGWNTYNVTVMNEEGAIFWILSERDWVEVLEPPEFRQKIKTIISNMGKLYE